MSALPILYSFRRCPYAMRARMGLLASGQQVELREVVLRDKPAEMIAVSAKATVPVLVLTDERVIDESLDIIDWALGVDDPSGLMSETPQIQRMLIDQLDTDFKPHLDRYKYPNRYPDEPAADHRQIAMEWILEHLAPRLEKHQNLFGPETAFADIASFPFVRQYAHVDRDWFYSNAPEPVCSWLMRHVESERFAAIMPKFKQWQSGDAGVLFP